MYKMVGQCGDGGWRLEHKSRLKESCEASQSPPRAVAPLVIMRCILMGIFV
jgi:hypothetical protein